MMKYLKPIDEVAKELAPFTDEAQERYLKLLAAFGLPLNEADLKIADGHSQSVEN